MRAAPLEHELAMVRTSMNSLAADSGARWLLACVAHTLEAYRAGQTGQILSDGWEELAVEGAELELTPLSPAQRRLIGETAARLGSLADDESQADASTRAACEDCARGLFAFLMPDDDLD
jgi:hypothetical protein